MSNKILNRIWEIGTAASRLSHLAVLTAIGDSCNDDGYCWMSLDTLENKVKRVKRRQLINLINDLEEAGDVAVIKTYIEDGRNTFNHYVVTVGMTAEQRQLAIKLAIRHTFGRGVVRAEMAADDGAATEEVTPAQTTAPIPPPADQPVDVVVAGGGALQYTPIGGEGALQCTGEGAAGCTGGVHYSAPDPSYDPKEDNKKGARVVVVAGGTPATGRPPAGLSELERQGYSPNPPTTANRYPLRPSLPTFLPLSLRAMDMTPEAMRAAAVKPLDALSLPARYQMDELGTPRPRLESERLWMLAVLGIACDVQLRTGLDDSAADPLWPVACDLVAEGVTPPQAWVAFADRAGYWWASEEHAWKRRPPTPAEVRAKWRAGLEWRPTAPEANGKGSVPNQAETAWGAVRRAISQFGRYRQAELLDALDEVTRAAVKAVGLSRLMDVDPEDRFAAGKVQRDFKQEYAEQARRLSAQTQAAD